MFLVRFALRNPYAVWAVAIGLCLLGLTMVPGIPADILPDFKTPMVVSYFSYPGMPPNEMEKSVTERIERILTLAGHIEHQESRSLPGAAVIKVVFQPGADPAAAMNEIINLEANDMHHLPPDIDWPFTLRAEPANLPVVLAAIYGEGLSETELYKIGYYAVRNKMGGLKGVQIPHPFVGKFRQMMVYVDPQKLRGLELAPVDVVNALKQANLVLAGGTMKLGRTDYQVHPINTLPTPEDIDNVPIAIRNGRPIFIRDVGYAKDDAAIQYNIARVNGTRSVYCPLLREPGENTIAVVDRIKKGLATEIPRMKERGEIPQEAKITLVSDQSGYIRNAIHSLEYEVVLGAILVALVIALFLRKFLASLAVLLVLPLAIVIGMLGFYFTGNTMNVMTLGGIALAIGTVVDAGIVVVENIMRHLSMGKTRAEAALEGSTEVATPVLAGTITTLAIFIPAIFLAGMIRYLFAPLALAATLTIGASYVVAMTIVPAFCSRVMRGGRKGKKEETKQITDVSEPHGLFVTLLRAALKARWLVIGTVVALVAASYLLFPLIGTELFPDVDAGTFEVRVHTIPGTRLEETEKLVARIEDTIREVVPEQQINTIISNIDLPTALRLANAQNYKIAIAKEKTVEASAQLDQSKALLLPALSVGASYHRHEGPLQETNGNVLDINRSARYAGLGAGAVGAGTVRFPGVSLDVDLADAFFEPLVARQNARAARAGAAAVTNQVLLEVCVAYYELVHAKAALTIAEETYQNASFLAELTKDFAQAGEGLESDAERAAVEQLLRERNLQQAREAFQVQSARLAEILHLDAQVQLEPADRTVSPLHIIPADRPLQELIDTALHNHPEVERQQALVDRAFEHFRQTKNGPLIPNLAFGFSEGDFAGKSGASGARSDFDALVYWQLRFGDNARTRAQHSQYRQARLERQGAIDHITSEVVQSYAHIAAMEKQISPSASAVERAAHSLQLNRTRIYQKQGLPIEVLQAIQSLETARRLYLNTVIDYNQAQFHLYTALGQPPSEALSQTNESKDNTAE